MEIQTRVTVEQAKIALDDMDDYAKMECGIDPIGARTVLEKFIAQSEIYLNQEIYE